MSQTKDLIFQNDDNGTSTSTPVSLSSEIQTHQVQPMTATQDSEVISTNSDKLISLHSISEVPVTVSAVLGKKKIDISSLLKMETGTIVDIDRKVGEPIDLYVNDTLIARGELILVDGNLGISMTEIIQNDATGVTGHCGDKNS